MIPPLLPTSWLFSSSAGRPSSSNDFGGKCRVSDNLDRIASRPHCFSVRYLHQDSLGSIAVLTDETANPANTERDAYDPWGKRRFLDGQHDVSGGGVPPSQTSRGFTGQEFLASVGLVHLNGRVYSSRL
jgi:hypothetical protein